MRSVFVKATANEFGALRWLAGGLGTKCDTPDGVGGWVMKKLDVGYGLATGGSNAVVCIARGVPRYLSFGRRREFM